MLQETRLRLAYDPAFREEFLARKRAEAPDISTRRKEKIRRTGGKAPPSGTADGGRLSAGVVSVCPSQSGPGDPYQL